MSSYKLDARNMLCPLPVIKTQDKRAVTRLKWYAPTPVH